LKSELKK